MLTSSRQPKVLNSPIWTAIILILLFCAFLAPYKLRFSERYYIPNLPLLLIDIFLLTKLTKRTAKNAALCISILFAFIVFNLVSSTKATALLPDKIRSSFLLFFNISSFILIVASYQILQPLRQKLARAATILSLVALSLAFLETKSQTFAQVSDQFRARVYEESLLYDAESRDFELAGKIRPKVFHSEPAHLAFALTSLSLIGTALGPSALVFASHVIVCLLAGIVIGSPIPVYIAICSFPLLLPRILSPRIPLILCYSAAVVIGAAICTTAYYAIPSVRTRMELSLSGKDRSSFLRTTFQVQLAENGLSFNPFSGVGIGGQEEIKEFLFSQPGVDPEKSNRAIQSPFWSLVLFTGIVGTSFVLAMLMFLAKRFADRPALEMIVWFLLLFQQGASIQVTFMWIVLAIAFIPKLQSEGPTD